MTLLTIQQYLFAALILLVVGGVGFVLEPPARNLPVPAVDEEVETEVSPTAVQTFVLDEANPVRLRIPAIAVDTSFVQLGIDENREIEVPESYEEVGWYQYGPMPGELGPAVVLGHVDSKDGPGVFYLLGQLEPGDRIEVDREDGTTAVFEVKMLEKYPQSSFPTSLVYGDIDHAGLRLITCSGSYDRELRRYDHNLVAYAELVED